MVTHIFKTFVLQSPSPIRSNKFWLSYCLLILYKLVLFYLLIFPKIILGILTLTVKSIKHKLIIITYINNNC